MPAGTKVTFKDPQPDTSTDGKKDATVVVTYPDGTTDEVPVTITVKPAPENTKYDPQPKPADQVAPIQVNDTPNPQDYITLPTDVPAGTKVTFKDPQPDTSTDGKKDATVVVTYPDGTTDEVPVTITVKPAPENTKYDPQPKPADQVAPIQVNDTPNPQDYITLPTDVPAGTKVTFKDPQPDTSTDGKKDATVVVTYPDGTTDEVPVTITVKPGASAGTGDTGNAKATSSVDGKCIATLVGWSLPLLALIPVGIALNAGIPVVEEAMRPVNEQLAAWNVQAQQQLGLFNPQLAEMANRYNQEIQMAATGLGVAAVAIGLIASIATTCGGAGSSNGSSR